MENKSRHGCVTAWLIFMIIANSVVALIYFFATEMVTDAIPELDSDSMILLLGVLSVLNVVFAVFLLQYKRWAFFGFVATAIGAFLINLSIGLGIFQSLMGLVGIGILYGILQIKQNGVSAWDSLD